jgi:hypothetical protein
MNFKIYLPLFEKIGFWKVFLKSNISGIHDVLNRLWLREGMLFQGILKFYLL